MESISTFLTIIAGLGAGIMVFIKALLFLNQTNISMTLLSHDERERHNFLKGAIFSFVMAFSCLYVGFFICAIFGEINKTKDITKLDEQVQQVNVDNDKRNGLAKNESAEIDIVFESSSNEINNYIVFISLGISILITVCLYIYDRKRIRRIRIIKFDRYLGFFIFLFLIFLTGTFNIVFAIRGDLKSYLVQGGILSILFGMSSILAVSYRGEGIIGREVAYLKSVYGKEVVYLFEANGDFIVAGDNKYITDCEKFWLIEKAKLKKPLLTAWNDEDVYLLKENVIINGDKLGKNGVLRIVVADAIKNNINLDADCKLNIEVKNKIIKYTVTDSKDEKSHSIKMKKAQPNDWNGNVILN
jgi:hypothetical protein